MTYSPLTRRFASLILALGAFLALATPAFAASLIDAHADITAEATSPQGAVVDYVSPAVDGLSSAECLPASGSTFPFGDTTVTCSAPDASDTTFVVHVVDTVLPLIGSHADKFAVATGFLTQVNYGAPNAFDPKDFRIDSTRPASCTPSDGSLFAIGTTPITCTATDSAGNEAVPTTFNVVGTLPEVIPEGFCGDGAHFDTELQTCVEDVPPPVIVDVCANIEDVQTDVPEGMTRQGEDCIATPVVTTGGRGGGGGGGGNSSTRGEVLGATTDTESSGGSCHLFSADLTLGSTGTEVTMLQNFLMGKGYAIAAGATGYFGAQTKAALASYQSASGIEPASGYFGPLTRMKVNASCPLAGSSSPTIAELLEKLAYLRLELAKLH
jgi:hypothetical protein